MKKGLLTLAAGLLLTAGSAFAQDYYLIGGFNGWALAQPDCKFTKGSNGEYTLDYQGTLNSGFKINDGTWGNEAANWGSNGSSLTIGKTYTLGTGSSSGNITMSENVEKPHIVFNPTANTLLITGQQVAAEYGYALHGSFVTNWESKTMTNNNGVWTLTTQVDGALEFGIKEIDLSTQAQTDWIASAGTGVVTLNTPMPCVVNGNNWSMTGTGQFTFKFDPKAMTLTVEGEGGGGGGTTPGITYKVHGNFSGSWASTPMTVAGADWKADIQIVQASGEFGVQICDENGEQLSENNWYATPVNFTNTAKSFNITSGGGNCTYDLTVGETYTFTFNPTTGFMTVEGTGQITPITYPEKIYVIGNVNDLGWAPNNVVELPSISNVSNGVYEGEVTFTSDIEFAYFSFCEKAGTTDNWEIEDLGTRWAAKENDLIVTSGNSYALQTSNADAAFKVTPGNYRVTVNLPELTVSFAVGTGVAELETENGEAVYFNLQGMRVANPENGLFIKVVDGKSTKVLLNK